MGCVQTKPSSNSPPRGIEKLKSKHGYVPASSVTRPPPRAVAAETVPEEEKGDKPPDEVPPELTLPPIAVGEDELVDGWPRWLVNNIPKEVLAGLVPKSADSYVKIDKVGQGTYSNVYKARDRETGKIVALKKVRFDTAESESVKFMAREIMILQKLDHPNILKLEGLATSRMHYSIYLVFDFMQSDLNRVISHSNRRLTESQIKCYMHQLLSGLQHCHEKGILHRDIKGSNILIDKDGVLKIGDFGLANYFIPKPKRPLTNRVVTLWYRAPELLLGSTDYGVGVDLWSAGCLLAEMFVGRPIMPARTEVEQLHKIFKLCGSPSGDYWKRLKLSTNFQPQQPYKPSISEAFKEFPVWTQKMLTILLALDPQNRGTATSALQNEFFTMTPLPCNTLELPILRQEEINKTNWSNESRRCITSRPRKEPPEKTDGQKKPDQTMDAMKVDSELPKEDENAKQLRHTQERRRPKDDHTSIPKPRADQLYVFENRSSSALGLHRLSVDQMPTNFAPLENTNISEKKVDTFQHYGLEMRFDPTSDFICFSVEWSPKNQATVD